MIGLVLVVIVSVHQLTAGRSGTAGIPAGQALARFVAPLATGSLQGDANVRPRCDPAHPNPRALNVCGRGKLVLALVSLRSGLCVREIDTLQALSAAYPGLAFAAVAVASAQRPVALIVRRHRWTIPVAYDRDGAVAELYGVAVCPIVELADGGRVVDRLIGERWLSAAQLRARLGRLEARP